MKPKRKFSRAYNKNCFSRAWQFCSEHLVVGVKKIGVAVLGFVLAVPAYSQQTHISSSGLGTDIAAPRAQGGQTFHDISVGTRPGNGSNLFHSFGHFSIGEDHVANFVNETNQFTSNIFGRVTGGDPSRIFGIIDTSDFGNANLYLINPNGLLFGPNAKLNVQGSFHASTADYLKFQDNIKFNALPGPGDALLTSAPVTAFGFLQTSNNSASINVESNKISVPFGQTLSLVGGNIGLKTANLSAPGGRINLASIISPGEVSISQKTNSLDLGSFDTLGAISLNRSNLSIESNPGPNFNPGSIFIRGSRLTLENGSNINGNIVITGPSTSGSVQQNNSSGTAIDIGIRGNVNISQSFVAVNTNVSDRKKAGAIRISADGLFLDNGHIQTDTLGSIGGGDIIVDVASLDLANSSNISADAGNTGAAGRIKIDAKSRVKLGGSNGLSRINASTRGDGNAGNISLTAPTIEVTTGGFIQSTSTAFVSSQNPTGGRAGDIEINTRNLTVNNGGRIVNDANARGPLIPDQENANIIIRGLDGHTAADSINIVGTGNGFVSEISSSTSGPQFGGQININARNIHVSEGARIAATSAGSGAGGTININSNGGTVTISGPSSAITSQTTGRGNAGNVVVTNGGKLTVRDGAQISVSVGPFGTGVGGNVDISASDIEIVNGGQISARSDSSSPDAKSGNVTVRFDETLRIVNNGSIVVDTTVADAGDININPKPGPTGFLLHLKDNAQISTTAGGGSGNGGNIVIDPIFVILEGGSSITAQAKEGSGGNINIVANSLFVSPDSEINASSTGGGIDGTVEIDSPATDILAGTLQLPENFANANALLSERCGARLSKASSFVLGGTGGMPPGPDTMISASLADIEWVSDLSDSTVGEMKSDPTHYDIASLVSDPITIGCATN